MMSECSRLRLRLKKRPNTCMQWNSGAFFQSRQLQLSLMLTGHVLQAWVANFERPRMNANSLLASPTGLSPYLRFGCLSCRLFYFKLTDLYKKVRNPNRQYEVYIHNRSYYIRLDFCFGEEFLNFILLHPFILCGLFWKVKKNSTPPLSLYGQLLWREFFYTTAATNPCFDKMEGNPVCVQIPWDRNPEALAKWAEGQTGFPWIDAIMTQLRQEGWIHHLARHAVACFLTRGDLWISWEEGMKVRMVKMNPTNMWISVCIHLPLCRYLD